MKICRCHAYNQPHNNLVHRMYLIKLMSYATLLLASCLSMLLTTLAVVPVLLSALLYASLRPKDHMNVPADYQATQTIWR